MKKKGIVVLFFLTLFWMFLYYSSNTIQLEQIFVTNFLNGERVYVDSMDLYSQKKISFKKDNVYLIIKSKTTPIINCKVKVLKNISKEGKIRIVLDREQNIIHSYQLNINDTLRYFYQKDSVQKKWLHNYFTKDYDIFLEGDRKKYRIKLDKNSTLLITDENFVKL